MFKNVLQIINEQYLSKLVAFRDRYINQMEMKNPQDEMLEMHVTLTDKQVFHDDLESVGC